MSAMIWVTLIGLAAAAGTTIALFPQCIKSWRTKKTGDLSLIMYVLLTSGVFLWLIYGAIIRDLPLILANAVSFVAVASTLFLKIKYG